MYSAPSMPQNVRAQFYIILFASDEHMDIPGKNVPWIHILLLYFHIITASGKYHWYSSLHKPWCYKWECCNEKWVPRNYNGKPEIKTGVYSTVSFWFTSIPKIKVY